MKTRFIKNSDFSENNKFTELSKDELKECNGGLKLSIYRNPDGSIEVVIFP